jgi:hypothetical protein
MLTYADVMLTYPDVCRRMLLHADVCYAVAYADNQECVSLLEAWPGGLLALLDEQCRLPRGSDEGFMDAVHRTKPMCC